MRLVLSRTSASADWEVHIDRALGSENSPAHVSIVGAANLKTLNTRSRSRLAGLRSLSAWDQ